MPSGDTRSGDEEERIEEDDVEPRHEVHTTEHVSSTVTNCHDTLDVSHDDAQSDDEADTWKGLSSCIL